MNTSYKITAFAVLAALIAALSVLPMVDSSAETTVQVANSGEGVTWVQISFDEEIESPFTLTVYDSDKQQVDSVELPNVDGWTAYTFKLNVRLDTGADYYMEVEVGQQTVYSNLDGTAVQPALRYIVVVDESENGSVEATPVFGASGTEVTLSVDPEDGFKVVSVTVNGKAASPVGADGAARAFATTTTAYGSFAVQDGAGTDSAVIVDTYTTTQSRTNTRSIVISSSADYDTLAGKITGDSRYTIIDTSSITGADVTAGYRAMGAAYLVKIAASADGYVANAVEIDGTSTYIYVLGDSITADTIGATVLSIAKELAAALQTAANYTFDLTADTEVSASFESAVEYTTDTVLNVRYSNGEIGFVIAGYDGKDIKEGDLAVSYTYLYTLPNGRSIPMPGTIDASQIQVHYNGGVAYGTVDAPAGIDLYTVSAVFSYEVNGTNYSSSSSIVYASA